MTTMRVPPLGKGHFSAKTTWQTRPAGDAADRQF